MSDDRLVSTAAAARALGVSRSTLWRWLNDGLVSPAVRLPGKHMRWDLDDLRRQVRHHYDYLEASPVHDSMSPEHPPVVAAIVTSHLGVLVGRRNDGIPPYTFIAGKIHEGESQADAAVREVKEETCLEVRAAGQEIGRRIHPKTGKLMIYLPCTPTEGTDVYVGDPEELAEVQWLSLPELEEAMGRANIFPPVWEHLTRVLA